MVALGVPSPPFPGNPLDPPLRSRFQARHIARVPAVPQLGFRFYLITRYDKMMPVDLDWDGFQLPDNPQDLLLQRLRTEAPKVRTRLLRYMTN